MANTILMHIMALPIIQMAFRSTVLDLANFMIAYLQNGNFGGQQLLSATSISEMLSLHVPSLDETQGLNWYQEPVYLNGGGTVNMWGHNGGETGVSTDLYINPSNNIGIVVLSNAEGDNLYVVDVLYNYALGLGAMGVGNPECHQVSVDDTHAATTLRVFPNPTTGLVQIQNMGAISKLEVFNAQGQLSAVWNNVDFAIDLSDLHPGIYLLRFHGSESVIGQTRLLLR